MLPTTGSTITAAISVAALGERRLDRGDRVERQRDGGFGESLRDAGGVGDPQRRHAGAGLHQQRIDVAVIAAFELDGEIAAGEAARQAQRAHGRFGAGVHQPHHFHRGHGLRDQLGQFDFALGGRAEAGAGFEHLAQRVDHRRRAMAQQQRSPGADVIDVRVAVDVEDARALAAAR